jgi:hypothetical protein
MRPSHPDNLVSAPACNIFSMNVIFFLQTRKLLLIRMGYMEHFPNALMQQIIINKRFNLKLRELFFILYFILWREKCNRILDISSSLIHFD